ncbi:MAG: LysM peptidoglycan-binding domain-containing protein, partial [Alphaproteobacteria bacterium]|nr:LysM peptidoglycan-binding domain-containing protein [Alphaproteobacteria bacterium]
MAALVAASLALAGCGTSLSDRPGDVGKPATAAAAPASETMTYGQAPARAAAAPGATTAYVVQRGDTLSALSRRHGSSVARLAALNELPPPYLLKVGQTLRLPTAAAAPVAAPDSGARLAALPALPGPQPAAAATGAPVPQAAPRAA